MAALVRTLLLLSLLVALLCATQVRSLPTPEDWSGVIQRTKRSLLWRWNSMKPLGSSCKEHLECGTKYCRRNTCCLWTLT
ncbi:liver-expressed antimicrobial peptide 2-like [Entelurus aequoreus]|nr:liver-expressed antimicrobial peptide 2-like [Entelurus aequoreus]XP_061913013.1 liver-expressed antimicrobial peptide 2-like [Entelurus aequoreus]XP_061913014.1 liver-expressed antimicrobial peptide 2-like [Entelurus aequoreus]XP_061913015.1 liver-expressed antimicrobial peptide 2-like [Entelurus aequoreus]